MGLDRILKVIMGVKNPKTLLELGEEGFRDTNQTGPSCNYRVLQKGRMFILYDVKEDVIINGYTEEK